MLKPAKSNLTILMKSRKLGKYFKEKCYSEDYQQLFFEYFVKPFLVSKLLLKVF